MNKKIFLAAAIFLTGIFIGIPALSASISISVAQAVTMNLAANHLAPEINQPFRVDVPLDTQGDDVNAIQGQVIFPSGQFVLNSINDGASPVTFWISPPAETASGTVSFSGIMPGGFDGAASSVVSFWFLPTASGTAKISLGNIQLLKNDGNGTPIPVATSTLSINVSATVASSTPLRPVSFVTPEPFLPVISRNPDMFSGRYFLSFSTTDKGSGIDYYQVLEESAGGTAGSWQTATSPYVLQDQALESNLYVRAIDHAGNFIIVEVPAEHPAGEQARRNENEILVFALCLVLLAIILFARSLLKPKKV